MILAAFVIAGCSQHDNHGSRHGGCCCCCGSGYGTGMSSSSSASTYRGFGQPTTFVNTMSGSLTAPPAPHIKFSINAQANPTAPGISMEQPILFNATHPVGMKVGMKVFWTNSPSGRVQLGNAGAGQSVMIPSFSALATDPPRTYEIEVYKDTVALQLFQNVVHTTNMYDHGDYDGFYSMPGPGVNAVVGIH